MNLILLPGNSIANKAWIEEVENYFKDLYEDTKILYYLHWENRNDFIDLDKELERLEEIVKNLDNYVIFAKSIGTILTLKGIYERRISPVSCIFLGTALLAARNNYPKVNDWLYEYNTPTLFIQKSEDPAIVAKDLLKELISFKVINYKFQEIPGDTHHYEDLTLIKNFVKEFIH